MNPLTLFELLLTREFQSGLGWGVIGLVILLAVPRQKAPRPIWGVVVSAVALVAALGMVGRRLGLVIGLVLVILGGELTRRMMVGGLFVVGLGAFTVAVRSGIETRWWIQLGTMLFIVVAGWMIGRIDHQQGDSGIPVLMVAGTVFGVWATVPDTELARVLMGTTVATVIAGWPVRKARIGSGGGYALAALLAWAVAIGGEARTGSIIGGWATVGAFPVALLGTSVARLRPWALFGLHAGSVFVASRIAGLQDSPYVALAISAPALIVTIIIGVMLAAGDEADQVPLTQPRSGDPDP